ncbi:conserved hypothetical protein [Talaromyces stipitatus ATCC 10500]|uniref:Heterokaryon incompatibility domain-containing protein n=1 Tax=Talaromyces stipitatus (strain ATCC 10500 / CBS 375.48 / QM 6759 / NRRL 1006) TaxID=441959 RepID=B8MQA8_TALSN|nr:uncharacterized protein TSTA_057460 [Talaromyces stipitatus ATCC 10500]EED13255.1 conserved hypothetical protein [Talaromyces stipitatus ATCC 10500]
MAEHLFYPEEPQKPLRIEYNGPLYDKGDWDQYPVRGGWRTETGPEKFSLRAIPQDLRDCIECWLYFGVLCYVFGEKLEQNDFLLRDDKQYLTTRELNKYVENAKDWKKNKLGERAILIVQTVCEQLSRYKSILRDEMKLAIRLICHALWNISVKRDGPQTKTGHVQIWLLSTQYEADQLLKHGWCPWEVTKARMTGGGVDTPAYLLQLVRKKPAWDKKTHDLCKKTECVVNNIKDGEYATRHVTEDCACAHLQADIQQLHTILLEGGVPLLCISPPESKDDGFKIEIVRKRSSRQYVAISHVWSDGLGNENGNTLPHCQIQLLYERARRLATDKEYVPRHTGGPFGQLHTGASRLAHFASSQTRGKDESVLIWIDTLCIPHQRDVRSLAIQRIREVYLDAYRTMILDSEMRQVESQSTPPLQLLLRVLYCSGWIRRLWTLQEGLAAKSKLYVLFSDKAINISTIADEILSKIDKGKILILQENVAFFAMAVWFSFFKHTIDYASKFERAVDVFTSPFIKGGLTKENLLSWNWYNVAMRATSKAGDRPIILAGVLNLDVKEILDVKGDSDEQKSDERMRKFYSLLDEFPHDIIFQEGPRFEEDGMRWAMKVCQFLDEPRYLGSAIGKITPKGLQISTLWSWLFPSHVAFDLSVIDFDEGQRAWERWLAEYQLEDATTTNLCVFKPKVKVELKPEGSYGIILMETKGSRPGGLSLCALVELQTDTDGVNYARYIGVGTVKGMSDFADLPEDGYLLPFGWDSLQKREWVVG